MFSLNMPFLTPLSYPLERHPLSSFAAAARLGNRKEAYGMTVPMRSKPNCDFSYAGLKNAFRVAVQRARELEGLDVESTNAPPSQMEVAPVPVALSSSAAADLCATFQGVDQPLICMDDASSLILLIHPLLPFMIHPLIPLLMLPLIQPPILSTTSHTPPHTTSHTPFPTPSPTTSYTLLKTWPSPTWKIGSLGR